MLVKYMLVPETAMKQFKFWAFVRNTDGTKEYREFTFSADTWNEARAMMSEQYKQARA
jgi:hypothetical protein